MPLGNFGSSLSDDASNKEISDLVSRLIKEVSYLLNGGLDTLNVNELSADVINAGVLNAMLVKIAAINGSYSYTFDETGIKANNGAVDTLKFDLATGLLTIVSAIIKSQSGFPQVTFNLNNNIIQAFSDANNHVDFSPQVGSAPGIAWIVGGVLNAYLQSTSAGPLLTAFDGSSIGLQADSGNLNLSVGANLNINGSPGYNGSFTYVKGLGSDGVGGYFPITGSITVKRGLITNVT